jgi:hypothetical protein
LNSNYLAARRLYRFLPTDENTYVHGGLSPEETIVPVAVYQPVTISPKPLTLHVLGTNKLFAGTKLDLNFEITNLNNYSCEQVQIEVIDPNVQTDKTEFTEISKLRRLEFTLKGRCHPTADPTSRKLHVRITYRFLGQPWSHDVDIPVEIIEPARAKFDLDNL